MFSIGTCPLAPRVEKGYMNREIFVAFIASKSLSAQKNLLRERLRTTLNYNPGSASCAHLTIKRPIVLSTDAIGTLIKRIDFLVTNEEVRPFEADLGNVSSFTRPRKDKGIVHLPVLGPRAKEVTTSLLSELDLPKVKYDGSTPHISLATVKLSDLQTALEQAKSIQFPRKQRFSCLVIFEKTQCGSAQLRRFDLQPARAA